MNQLSEQGLSYKQEEAFACLDMLTQSHEQLIMKSLVRYPEVIQTAAGSYEPHQICFYLRDLANEFHSYYNSHQFIVDDPALRNARISLILAVRQVIRNGLEILGVTAPDKM
jgi:arginyl-tRNA synthetase